MDRMNRIQIIGIGDDGLEGLTAAARRQVKPPNCCSALGKPLAAAAQCQGQRKREMSGDLEQAVRLLQEAGGKRVVILASGDPLFYGTTRFFVRSPGQRSV